MLKLRWKITCIVVGLSLRVDLLHRRAFILNTDVVKVTGQWRPTPDVAPPHISHSASRGVLVVIGDGFLVWQGRQGESVGPFAGVWLALQMQVSVGVSFNKLKVPLSPVHD